MATATKEITLVECRWDDQDGIKPGWYCAGFAGDRLIADSPKIWWPVDVDEYGREDADDLLAALEEAFPGAEIIIR